MDVIHRLLEIFPNIALELRVAHMKVLPRHFIKQTFTFSLAVSSGITLVAFMLFGMLGKNVLLVIPVFFFMVFAVFFLLLQRPKTVIAKRRRELDREVLFAGRFLLVKIRSGVPLMNALIMGSQSYGVASKYFKEIVDDISMGTNLETALDNAMRFTPSPWFRKILFQINNALKIGIDISSALKNTLDEISHHQLMEIQRYGKKLNTLAIFYLLLAVVLPSLGVVMFVVIGSMAGFLTPDTASAVFFAIIGVLIIIQAIFMLVFKSERVTVNV